MGYVSFMGFFTPKNLRLRVFHGTCYPPGNLAPWCLAHWAKSKHCAKASGFPPAELGSDDFRELQGET